MEPEKRPSLQRLLRVSGDKKSYSDKWHSSINSKLKWHEYEYDETSLVHRFHWTELGPICLCNPVRFYSLLIVLWNLTRSLLPLSSSITKPHLSRPNPLYGIEAHVNKVRRDSNFEWELALGVLRGRFRNGMTKDIKYQESEPVRTSTICRWERLLRSLEDLLEGAFSQSVSLS